MTSYCANCGAEYFSGATDCARCGALVPSEPIAVAADDAPRSMHWVAVAAWCTALAFCTYNLYRGFEGQALLVIGKRHSFEVEPSSGFFWPTMGVFVLIALGAAFNATKHLLALRPARAAHQRHAL